MKKLIILVATLVFLPSVVFASVCDGKNVKLINRSPLELEVNSVNTYKTSVITPLEVGTKIRSNDELLTIIHSGDGSYGHAQGDIGLFSREYPGKVINLHYEAHRILFWCVVRQPEVLSSPLPFSVHASKDGDMIVFEILGATPDDVDGIVQD